MKLLGSTEKDVDQDRDGKNVPKLESVEVVLVHCNVVKNNKYLKYYLLLYLINNLEN